MRLATAALARNLQTKLNTTSSNAISSWLRTSPNANAAIRSIISRNYTALTSIQNNTPKQDVTNSSTSNNAATKRRAYTTHSQLPSEHQMVYEMCRKFADEELSPNAGEWDKEHKFPTDAVDKLVSVYLCCWILAWNCCLGGGGGYPILYDIDTIFLNHQPSTLTGRTRHDGNQRLL